MIDMKDIVSIERNSVLFKFSWKMTNWCNYRCSYCYMANNVKNAVENTPKENLLTIAKNIDNLAKTYFPEKPFMLHLIGGEVGYFNLIEVLEQIESKQLKKVLIVTNLSSSLDYWLRLRDYCENRGCEFTITASMHLEFCDPDEFMQKLSRINQGNNRRSRAKCVVNDENILKYLELTKKYPNVVIQPTVERIADNENSSISEKTMKIVDFLNSQMKKSVKPYFFVTMKDGSVLEFSSNIELINSVKDGGLDPEGFYCSAGLDGLRIEADGSLRLAGCQWCGKPENRIGSLLTNEYTMPTEPIQCHTTIDWQNTGKLKHKFCTAFGNTSMCRDKEDLKKILVHKETLVQNAYR